MKEFGIYDKSIIRISGLTKIVFSRKLTYDG